MAIAVDGSSPSIAVGTGSGAVVSNSFTPPSNSLVLVAALNTATNQAPVGILGAGLVFTQLASTSQGTSSFAGIYAGDFVTSPGSMTVQTQGSSGTWIGAVNTNCALAVLVLTGAAVVARQTGATGALQAGVFTTGVSLPTAAATSWLFAACSWFEGSTVPTFSTSQTATFNGKSQAVQPGGSQWFQGNIALGNANTTMNVTAPTGTGSNSCMVAIEILEQAGTVVRGGFPGFGMGMMS